MIVRNNQKREQVMFFKQFAVLITILFIALGAFPSRSSAQVGTTGYRQVFYINPTTNPNFNLIGWAEWSHDGTKIGVIDYPATELDENSIPIVHLPYIHMLNTTTWEVELTIAEALAGELAWNPTGDQVASVAGGDNDRPYGTLSIWDTNSGELATRLVLDFDLLTAEIPTDYLYVVFMLRPSWSPDGTKIVNSSTGVDLILWDLVAEDVYVLGRYPQGQVGEMDWSPDSSKIASGGVEGVRIWDVDTGEIILTINESSWGADWHPTQNKILLEEFDNEASVWDTDTGQNILSLRHEGELRMSRWNFDGSLIATGDLDGTIRIWDSQTGEEITTIREQQGSNTSLNWHPTQNLLASTSYNGELWVWQIDD